MGFLLLYGLLSLLPCFLAAAAAAAVCMYVRRHGRRGWMSWVIPGVLAVGGIAAACVLLLRDLSWAQGYTAGENAVTVLARLFICLLPCLAALIGCGIVRLRPAWAKALLILLLLGLTPVTAMANDGGSVTHAALLYRITFYHKIDDARPTGFRTDTVVLVAPFHFIQDDG